MTPASGLICVSVSGDDGQAMQAALAPVLPLVDVVEIRLDTLLDPGLELGWIGRISRPVLATNRPTWEGGRFIGNENQRIALLCQALAAGAHYVDIELRTAPELRLQVQTLARQQGARVICSSHDFQTTPSSEQLRRTLATMIASGADIGKIITTATQPAEALRILALQQEAQAASFPLSAFAMGAAGKITRLATLYLGGCMTYAAISPDQATAPGQLTVAELQDLIALLGPTP